MLRQSTSPIQFDTTRRMDNRSVLTSGKAGVVIPVSYAPLLRGDSASGRVAIDMQLAEMPKPLENMVIARAQAWFVPRPALPQFSGLDEYTHSYQGKDITTSGSSARTPAALFNTVGTGAIAAAQASELFKAMGISLVASTVINTDLIDSYNLVQNFRLASHTSKITRYDYYSENATTSLELKPAFWPRNRMTDIVPDYESALVVGQLDLDVSAGQVPVSGITFRSDNPGSLLTTSVTHLDAAGNVWPVGTNYQQGTNTGSQEIGVIRDAVTDIPAVFAELTGTTVPTNLASIDKARTTQAFAKARAAMAGTNYSGFNNDDVLVAELMAGFSVPPELFNRPWLLDSKTVTFGMKERHATDAANLDDSVVTGRATITLSINIPKADYGGLMITTVEVLPERLYERQQDTYLYKTAPNDLPNALRDIQITEPVSIVANSRLDTAHSTPTATFGYEPLNAEWRREFTSLGGEFRQLTPGTPVTTARTAIWQADYVNPAFTSDHTLAVHPFPQDVFSAPAADIVNISVLQQLTISGITQFGDQLTENNTEFAQTEAEA